MKNRQRGVAALEMALVLPLLLLIVFGIVDFSLLLFDKAVITNAAREGARWASIHSTSYSCTPTGIDPCGIANSYAKNYLVTLGSVTLQSELTPSGTYSSGDRVTITTKYTYTGIGFELGSMLSTAGLLTAVSSMYHE